MRKEIILCDRCKKELNEKTVNPCMLCTRFYDLCDECYRELEILQVKIEELNKRYEKEEKELWDNFHNIMEG